MAKLTSDQIGTLGERFFPNVCDEGLHVHKVGEDRTGWDFYLDWVNVPQVDLPFDLDAQPLSCQVQVKALGPKSEWISANLASVGRLAKEPKPCFVYVISYDDANLAVQARVIPVRGAFLAKILREQRRASVQGRKPNSTFRFKASDWGIPIDIRRESLRKYLETEIGPDISVYMAAKKFEYDHLGYEEGRIVVRGRFLVADQTELRSAYLSGTDLSLDVTSAVDRRFGLEIAAPDVSIGPTVGRFVGQKAHKGTVRLWPGPLEQAISFDGKWHILPDGIAEPGFGEGVFQSALFSVLGKIDLSTPLEDQSCDLTFQVDGSQVLAATLKPSQWDDFYRLMVKSLDTRLRLRLEVAGKPDIGGELKLNHPTDSQGFYRKMASLTATLNKACNIAGSPNLTLRINDLHVQGPAMLQLSVVLDGKSFGQANFGSLLTDPIKGGETLPLLYLVTIPLGDFALMYCMRIDFISTRNETEVTWNSTDMELLKLTKVSAPVGDVVSADAVAFLDEMRLNTGIDSYYFANLPTPTSV